MPLTEITSTRVGLREELLEEFPSCDADQLANLNALAARVERSAQTEFQISNPLLRVKIVGESPTAGPATLSQSQAGVLVSPTEEENWREAEAQARKAGVEEFAGNRHRQAVFVSRVDDRYTGRLVEGPANPMAPTVRELTPDSKADLKAMRDAVAVDNVGGEPAGPDAWIDGPYQPSVANSRSIYKEHQGRRDYFGAVARAEDRDLVVEALNRMHREDNS